MMLIATAFVAGFMAGGIGMWLIATNAGSSDGVSDKWIRDNGYNKEGY
jgi:hypothetical protein